MLACIAIVALNCKLRFAGALSLLDYVGLGGCSCHRPFVKKRLFHLSKSGFHDNPRGSTCHIKKSIAKSCAKLPSPQVPNSQTQALVSFAILGWSAQPGKTPIEYTSLAFLALLGITGEGVRVCISIG